MKSLCAAILAAGFAFTPAAASADAAAAEACAGDLTPHGKMIYEATKPRIKPGVVIADELRSAVRPMVMGGKMSRSEAQPAAEAAGKCLAKING